MVLLLCRKAAQPKIDQHLEYSEASQIKFFRTGIRIGAACTYTALRVHDSLRGNSVAGHAASWTGGIANQNRGRSEATSRTASPAADSLPALLVYDAELTLISVRGERRVDYRNFHTGYKQTALAADEFDSRYFAGAPILWICFACAESPETRNDKPFQGVPRRLWPKLRTAPFGMCVLPREALRPSVR